MPRGLTRVEGGRSIGSRPGGSMHRIFQTFIDRLAESVDPEDLHKALADAAAALDLGCFAYLSMPHRRGAEAQVISTYPADWTGHYVECHYERIDPVILQAARGPDPFEWGLDVGLNELTKRQQQFFDEAAGFGIRCGFTIPIHDGRGPVAAVAFAADERHPAFRRSVEAIGRHLAREHAKHLPSANDNEPRDE